MSSPNARYKALMKQSRKKLDNLVENRTGNKYNAKGRHYNGEWFDSTGEMEYCQKLDILRDAGAIQDYKRQVKIDIKVNGVHIANYFCDFKVINKSGGVEYHEYKGFETDRFKILWRLFQALKEQIDPGCELVLIKHQGKYKQKSTWK